VPYPDHLKENMPMTCPNSWVVNQFREKYSAYGCYLRVEEDVLNIGIEYINSVYNLFMYIFNFILHL